VSGPAAALTQEMNVNRTPQLNTTPQELRRLEVEVFEAIKNQNTQALSRLLFDNYVYRSPGDDQLGKDDFLRLVEAFPVKVTALWGEEMRVNVYGETAIVTGIQLSKTRDNTGQEEMTATSFSDVFIRRAGRWLLALTLATDLAEIPPQYRVAG
jgi:ketosteroid isomerase-like protein